MVPAWAPAAWLFACLACMGLAWHYALSRHRPLWAALAAALCGACAVVLDFAFRVVPRMSEWSAGERALFTILLVAGPLRTMVRPDAFRRLVVRTWAGRRLRIRRQHAERDGVLPVLRSGRVDP